MTRKVFFCCCFFLGGGGVKRHKKKTTIRRVEKSTTRLRPCSRCSLFHSTHDLASLPSRHFEPLTLRFVISSNNYNLGAPLITGLVYFGRFWEVGKEKKICKKKKQETRKKKIGCRPRQDCRLHTFTVSPVVCVCVCGLPFV